MKPLIIADYYFGCLEVCRAFRDICPSSAIHQVSRQNPIDSQSFKKLIEIEKPSFIFTANMHGLFDLDDETLDYLEKINLPIAIWFLDNPKLLLGTKKGIVRKNMVSLTWDGVYVDELKSLGFKTAHKLPLATDPMIFYPTENIAEEFSSKISFVGSSSLPLIEDIKGTKLYWNEVTQKIAATIEEGLTNGSFQTFEEGLASLNIKIDAVSHVYLESLIILEMTHKYRHSHLSLVDANFDLKIYGDRGWQGLTKHEIRTVDYVNELNLVYNGSAVNLSLKNVQMKTGLNQRIYDVSSAGGFVLTDYTEDLSCLFDIGSEVICFTSKEDMIEKIRYFLENPSERLEISQRARQRILKDHTYMNRIGTVIKIMKELL